MARVCQNCGKTLELLKDSLAKSLHKLGGETRELVLCDSCARSLNDAEKMEKAFDGSEAPGNDNRQS